MDLKRPISNIDIMDIASKRIVFDCHDNIVLVLYFPRTGDIPQVEWGESSSLERMFQKG